MSEIIKRSFATNVEIRAAVDGQESRTIEGYAIVFDDWSENLGWFVEKVDRNALEGVDMSNVIATFNHDFSKPMARASKGTLQLSIDEKGLKFSFDAPNTTSGNDLLENVRNGNVDGCSFMFTIREESWEWNDGTDENPDKRTILGIERLIELGPVTVPAYSTTSVSARSRNEVMEKLKPVKVEDFDTTVFDLRMKMSQVRNKIKQ